VQFDNPDPELTFVHRRDQSRDVYFLTNLSASGRTFQATFRDGNGSPEFWDPMTGKITLAPIFTRGTAGTKVPIYLEPHGSILVAFDGGTGKALIRSTNLSLSSLDAELGRRMDRTGCRLRSLLD
jgi:hypothetical protein